MADRCKRCKRGEIRAMGGGIIFGNLALDKTISRYTQKLWLIDRAPIETDEVQTFSRCWGQAGQWRQEQEEPGPCTSTAPTSGRRRSSRHH